MRNLLAALIPVLALALVGCQNSISQRNNSAWNDQSSSSRPAYRQNPARAERFGFRQASLTPDSIDAEDPAFRRQQNRLARRAYRQSQARADDPSEFGQAPMASDGADVEDPAFQRQQNRLARRAYRQSLARADDPSEFGQAPMAADVVDGEDPTLWRQQNRLARRAHRQSQARADDPSEFGQDSAVSDAADMEDPAFQRDRNNFPRRADRQNLARADIGGDVDEEAFGERARASDLTRRDTLPSGFKTVTLQHDGHARSYLLYVPTSYRSGQPTPLVMVFHGGGGNASNMVRKTQMDRLAERYNFIVVYPNGTSARDSRLTWNTGSTTSQGYAESNNIDDVGFVRAILQQVGQSYAIDSKRIYATGLSKGAMFSYRLACELSDQFAAIAPVAGALTYTRCQPAQAVAVLHIHGSNDQNVPFEGGRGAFSAARNAGYPSALEGLNRWRKRNNCAATPTKKTVADTERVTYGGCESGREVAYYVVRGGGHGWPGATPNRRQRERGIYISNQLNASAEIWKFFAAHPKP